ncbi:MAG: tRNA (guanosine(46)-N7)-methyltransferase TrmB [Oscillospiraceae bacterium]|nr:tRNA (guanosine(46)-N7)-methyltransferase TrmB [Oscillospiraceae bacterium]
MRMRRKPNLDARLEKCADLLVGSPEQFSGRWCDRFGSYSALQIELGCGKGRFTADCAAANPDVLLVAVERDPSALVMAMELARSRDIANVRFLLGDVGMLDSVFASGEAERIYLNFPDPWPKSRDAKLRLTAPNFLRRYACVLAPLGELWFKTDNTPLFDWSLDRFADEGWTLREVTHDLHANGVTGILTGYEARFIEQGLAINRLVAVREPNTKTVADGQVPRLRDASLCDARGYDESKQTHAKKELPT